MAKKKIIPVVDRERIIESVYHIVYMGNISRNTHNVFLSIADKIDGHEKMLIRYLVQSQVMLNTISLLDEINKYLFNYDSKVEVVVKEKIESYRYIVEPVLTEIAKWTSLRQFRNNVLAHNFRNNKNNFKSVFFENELHKYVIPGSTMDLLTLFQFTDRITKIAEEMFKDEYKEALKMVGSFDSFEKEINQSIQQEVNRLNEKFLDVNKRIAEYNNGV